MTKRLSFEGGNPFRCNHMEMFSLQGIYKNMRYYYKLYQNYPILSFFEKKFLKTPEK